MNLQKAKTKADKKAKKLTQVKSKIPTKPVQVKHNQSMKQIQQGSKCVKEDPSSSTKTVKLQADAFDFTETEVLDEVELIDEKI